MDDEFPPNDHGRREARGKKAAERAPEKKDVAQVTRGRTIQRKKPLRKRIAETFTGDSSKGVWEYVLLDVAVPGLKDILADISTTAIERTLFGDVRSGARRHRSSGGGYTSYNSMGAGRRRDRRDRDDDRRPGRRESHSPSDHREIIVESRIEAEEVLDSLITIMDQYDAATKRDLLSLVGEPHSYTDEDWGWTDLRGARIHRVRDGWLLDLPRPEPLD